MNDEKGLESPGTEFGERQAALSPAKRALLLARARKRSGTAGDRETMALEPVPRGGDLPLSFAQQRLWFLDQLLPGASTYNIPTAWRLHGPLDIAALTRSVETVVARHESLRTRVVLQAGVPVQVIDPAPAEALPLTDLSALAPAVREIRAQALVQAHARQPFDLATGPLFRAQLLRLVEDEHLLLVNVHHIVSDGWSGGVFHRELAAAYGAFARGVEPVFPALPIQYADYAVWQRRWLQGSVLATQLGYWRRQLADLHPLELPSDRPRPPVASHQGTHLTMDLSVPLTAALKDLGRRERATLFMTLLAAFQVLLSRYSGQTDIAVGSPIAGRGRPEFEGLIGFFANTLVLRTDLSGDPSFRAVLARVRDTALGAYTHQDLPFEKLVEELAPARDLSRHPLFQVMFVLQNTPGAGLALDGVEVSRLSRETQTAKFDLTLSIRESAGELHLRWEYASDLFEASTIWRMAGHFQMLLEAIVTDPDEAIGQLPLLTEAERHQLAAWNDTAADYRREDCIHQAFERQAARTPDAVAAVDQDRQLTYAELNARANQLAHQLRALGVGPEVLVGICLERSVDMVAGLLGILKAGGAYVPLDPSYPPARVAFMLSDTDAPVLVTQQVLLGQLPSFAGHVLCLDRDAAAIAAQPDTNPDCRTTAASPAYVIYTSGSTGTPKGVVIPHRAVVNLLTSTSRIPGLRSDDVLVAVTTLAFDIAVLEFQLPLTIGATVVIATRACAMDGHALGALLEQHRATALQATPATWRLLLETGWSGGTLRKALVGGEALGPDLAERLIATGVELWNMYGPTETTVWSTCARITDASKSITIGKPIANTYVWIMDAHQALCPIGVPGELVVGGDGVALGYWNRPALTAEKFLPDSFSSKPGARMYRTGDRARYLVNGDLEFLGRLDDQVKIRGFRIELGEIEAVLGEHPAVRQAVVLAREDTPGDTRLVAYVVPDDAAVADVEPLRSFVRIRLPDYMQPTAYVVLEHLPLTPAGKVDRRTLPAPQYGRGAVADSFVAPRDAIEEAIAEVWREVLRVEQVGVHDNFFELGGHSLLATQVLARLAQLLPIELSLHGFFESPTVSALALRVRRDATAFEPISRVKDLSLSLARQQREAEAAGEAVVLESVPREYPLSFAQQRLWFLDRLLPGTSTYNMPMAWRLHGPLDVVALTRSVEAVVARHESLRTRVALRGGAPVQVIDPAPPEVLRLIDLSALTPAERAANVSTLAETHARQPFDLAEGPLFRAQLLRLTADEHVLLVNVHHIVSDGWSLGVFRRELGTAYGACVLGTDPAFQALPIQYADYAAWQRSWLQGAVLAAQRGYWQRQLADLHPLDLPADRPRPPVPSRQGAALALDLSAAVTAALKALGRAEGATLFMTLLAAFQVLLSRYSGQTDIAVGSPIAGRGRPELEGLIGFFVNTLVLRSDLSGNPSFREVLASVRDTALGAYTHQDLPFEKLVEELAPARDLSRHPLFQVMFVLQNMPGAQLALEGLTTSRLSRETESAKFDLTLSVRESAAGLRLHWEYARDLFDAATIVRLAGHFEVLLAAIVADPAQRIQDLPLLTEAERHQLLVTWNDTATDYPRDRCIHQLFEAQASRTPEAVAVVCGDRQLTYAALNAQANRLAHQLRALGVSPEVLVGICVERSLELVVGLLGILKAGGAYVPLDPNYPTARVAFMLSDTHAPVLVTEQALLGQLPPFDGHVLCLDRDTATIAAQPDTNPECLATAETLAYVMYTSGSTGKPKGVAVCHRGIVRLVCNTDYVEIDTQDCIAQISNPAFDAATFEIWGALANGSSLVVISRDVALDVSRLQEALRRRRISTMFLTSALFNEVVRARPDAFAGLKTLLVGGEALDPRWIGECIRAGGPQRLLNGYGPTECTTFATWHLVQTVEPGTRTIPIGRPIANTVTYVLDGNRQPVPIGVAGELYLGGAGLARGYWNQPGLTTDRFVSDPFSPIAGARMYRTGDRVRYLANGDLEFLGRLDDQVKIRGFRIELGEIESVLGEHPAVRQTVVLAREDTPGDKRLVAYVVPAPADGVDTESLRAFVRTRLPDYMQPSGYVTLGRLPLTATGKIDRRALNAPSRETTVQSKVYEPPRDDVERTLCKLWAQVLNVPQVGIDADFFELGGHSLLAAQLFARLDQTFGRALPLATLFEAPTVRGLAPFYRDRSAPSTGGALIPITSTGSGPRVFAVPGVGGNILGFTTLARDLGRDQPFFGLQSAGLDGSCEPTESIEQMAAHYLREIKQIQPRGPYVLLGACFGATVAFEMTHQLLDEGEEVAFLGLLDPSSLGGDLADRPPLPIPSWLKRCAAFASFVVSRVRLYLKQIRSLEHRRKAQLISSKLKVAAEIIRTRDVFRGGERQFHQRRIKAANLRALRRYRHRPLMGGPSVDVFRSGRRFDSELRSGVNWESLVGTPIIYHDMPGRDSGDMLRGRNAKVLADRLAIRLHQTQLGLQSTAQQR